MFIISHSFWRSGIWEQKLCSSLPQGLLKSSCQLGLCFCILYWAEGFTCKLTHEALAGDLRSSTRGHLHRAVHDMASPSTCEEREIDTTLPQWPSLQVTHHCFHFTVFLRNESLGVAHSHGEGTPEGMITRGWDRWALSWGLATTVFKIGASLHYAIAYYILLPMNFRKGKGVLKPYHRNFII